MFERRGAVRSVLQCVALHIVARGAAACDGLARTHSHAPPQKKYRENMAGGNTQKLKGCSVSLAKLYANPSSLFSGVGSGMQLKSRACVWGRD